MQTLCKGIPITSKHGCTQGGKKAASRMTAYYFTDFAIKTATQKEPRCQLTKLKLPQETTSSAVRSKSVYTGRKSQLSPQIHILDNS